MTTLFDSMISVARTLDSKFEFQSTSASTSTTSCYAGASIEDDDWYNGGTVFNLNRSLSAVVSDFVKSTGQFVHDTITGQVQNDRILALHRRYTREQIISAINSALVECGTVSSVDTSLTTVAGQEEYTLPAAVYDVRQVEVATNTASPYNYEQHLWWVVNGNKLNFIFKVPSQAGYKIRLTYAGRHATVAADTDTISPSVHPERLRWEALCSLMLTKVQNSGTSDKAQNAFLSMCQQQILLARRAYPIVLPARAPILGRF